MNELLSQLWICLAIATLLGSLIGWFVRGDKSQKLAEIENRWHKRFSDLEYTNQSLIRQLKDCMKQQRSHKTIVSKLDRMKKGAELSSVELKQKIIKISDLELELESKLSQAQASSKPKLPALAGAQDLNQQDKTAFITELESKHGLLANKVDDYKASLLDAESKLQVAYGMLKTQGLNIMGNDK